MQTVTKFLERLKTETKNSEDRIYELKNLQRLKDIAANYEGSDKVVISDVLIAEILNEKEQHQILSGFPKLDKIIRGFREEQVIVISAAPKSGKTSFCMAMTETMGPDGVLWFPFEESAKELLRKYNERGVTAPKFYTPLVIKENSLEWIETKIIEGIAKYGIKVVFIDQLDFIVAMGGDKHDLRMAQTMRELKGIAKKYGITVFIICHLTKIELGQQPTTNDFRGSSAIAGEADTAIILWRETYRENKVVNITNNVVVSVQLNRRMGSTGNVKMVYKNGTFKEEDWIDSNASDADIALANF